MVYKYITELNSDNECLVIGEKDHIIYDKCPETDIKLALNSVSFLFNDHTLQTYAKWLTSPRFLKTSIANNWGYLNIYKGMIFHNNVIQLFTELG